MTTTQNIREILTERFAPTTLEVVDDSASHAGHAEAVKSGGGHYGVRVISKAFEGKTPMQRHRMVYQALNSLIGRDIHALSIQALTPGEIPRNSSG